MFKQNSHIPQNNSEIIKIINHIAKDYSFLNLTSEDLYEIYLGGGYLQILT